MTEIEIREGLVLGEIVMVSTESLDKLEARVLAAEARLKELESGGRQEWRVRSDSYTSAAVTREATARDIIFGHLARHDHTNVRIETRRLVETPWVPVDAAVKEQL